MKDVVFHLYTFNYFYINSRTTNVPSKKNVDSEQDASEHEDQELDYAALDNSGKIQLKTKSKDTTESSVTSLVSSDTDLGTFS